MAPTASSPPPASPPEELAQSYSTQNHALTIRYPADFALTTLDLGSVKLERMLAGGEGESIMFVSSTDAAVTDARELADKIVSASEVEYRRKGITFTRDDQRPSQCLGKYEGVEVDAH